MHKTYRFHWQSRKKCFTTPTNLSEIAPESRRKQVQEIVQRVKHQSGLAIISTFYLLLMLIVVFIGLMILTYVLIKQNNVGGKVLVIITPFLSFAFIVYTMARKSGLVRVNEYLAKTKDELDSECRQMRMEISCQFVQSGFD